MTDTTTITAIVAFGKRRGACSEALAWLRAQPDAATAWEACERPDWLIWWLKRQPATDRKTLVRIACACARTALRFVPEGEERPRLSIETTERWLVGDAAIEEVRTAAAAAAAYDAAYANFERGNNDATAAAQLASQQAALAAQGQFYDQNAVEAQLANALAQAQMSASASMYGSDQGARASMYGADIGRMNFTDNLGYQRERGDMSDLMGLIGLGNQNTSYNNGLLGFDQERAGAFNGMIPGVNPTAIDVTGPYNANYQAQVNNANQQNASQAARDQQQQQLWTTLASWAVCSRDLKTPVGPVEPAAVLAAVRGLPVEKWKYHGSESVHFGTYAEDFNEAIVGERRPVIALIDMMGALVGAVKALADKVDNLEASRA